MQTDHKQVRISARGFEADVDDGLAPLMLALGRAGVCIAHCRQEYESGVAWIAFPTAEDAKRFLDIVAQYPDDRAPFWKTLYARLTGRGDEGDWEYDIHPKNWAVDEVLVDDEVVETNTGPADFEFEVSVRFPVSDIPLILNRVSLKFIPPLDATSTAA
jgi:hypothetical protein